MDDADVILYDGVCGLCNRFNRFVLDRDRAGRFRFASLQSQYARRALQRHGKDPDALETMYVLVASGAGPQRVLSRARAALFVLGALGWPWRLMTVFGLLPTWLLDLAYNAVAGCRYRLAVKHDSCPLPDPAHRERFIEV